MKRLFVATAFAASAFGVHPHEVDVSLIGYSFGPVERAVFNSQSFPAGKYVIKEGQIGDRFYIVKEGKLVAEKAELNG